MTKETFLPIFPGFYGTSFEPSEDHEITSINEYREEPVSFDEITFNYRDYYDKVGRNACNWVEKFLNENGLKIKIRFIEIDSPREYNFRNDRIACKITCSFSELQKMFLLSDPADYLKWQFKSRIGFISFYPYRLEDWETLKPSQFDSIHLWAMLEAIIYHIGYEEDEFYEVATMDAYVYAENFAKLTGTA